MMYGLQGHLVVVLGLCDGDDDGHDDGDDDDDGDTWG